MAAIRIYQLNFLCVIRSRLQGMNTQGVQWNQQTPNGDNVNLSIVRMKF